MSLMLTVCVCNRLPFQTMFESNVSAIIEQTVTLLAVEMTVSWKCWS